LALELVRVTEAAALNAGKFMGKGDKNAADQAAVDMMRFVFDACVGVHGVVVIGEGEKDQAPMLFNGEHLGDLSGPLMDVAVDPIDGTKCVAKGLSGAISVIAMSEAGSMFSPGPCMYMEKLAVGPQVPSHHVSLAKPIKANLLAISEALHKPLDEITVVMLDRDRHEKMIEEIRKIGSRIRLIGDGDVAGAIEVAKPDSPADVLLGVGGTPEGVLAACALKCMGGSIQGRLWPRDDEERQRTVAAGYQVDRILHTNDLCSGNKVFFAATGITESDLLPGIRYNQGGAITHSVVMRAQSGTIRWLETNHRWDKSSATNPLFVMSHDSADDAFDGSGER
jgi:fructose-1,6-bisphosphatase II